MPASPSKSASGMLNFSRRLKTIAYFLPAALVIFVVGIGIARAIGEEQERFITAQRLAASEQLSRVSSRLESAIHGNVNLIQGLAATIAAHPSMTQAEFVTIAERIFSVPSQLRNVAAAPDLVVSMVYPYAENKEIIGMDYTAHPKQAGSVMEAIKRRATMIAGPVKLVQGGSGLLVRYPVFSTNNGHFWGIVSSLIDADRLYRDSNLDTGTKNLNIAISRRPTPREKDVFYGDATLFSKDSVRKSIEFGYDTWYLAAEPKAGWPTTSPRMTQIYIYALIVGLCVLGPLIWAGLLMKQRHGHIRTLQQREEQLETVRHRLALALDASEIGVWEYEPSTDRLIWDERLRKLYSAAPEQRVFTFDDWLQCVHPDDRAFVSQQFNERSENTLPYIPHFRIVTPEGEVRHIRAYGASFLTTNGVERMAGANWDVTLDVNLQNDLRNARLQAEEQNAQLRATRRTLEHQSLHDALTGLPNRRFLDQFMEASAAATPNHRLAFIHFDMDRFKEVNDTLGHAAGDEVLRQATLRLQKLLHGDEFASRIGGDEFVIVTSGSQPEERALHLGSAIVKALSKPITFEDHECHVGCSAGIAVQTLSNETPRQLLINADVALYEAKKRGRNRAELFSENLLQAAIHTKRSSDELLIAIENDQIIPFFQPQFDARTLDIVGVEALARWEHPTRGLLSPAHFLDIAEGLHRSGDIDAIILEKALFQAARWRLNGLDVPKVSVNISAQRLKDENLLAQIAKLPMQKGSLSL